MKKLLPLLLLLVSAIGPAFAVETMSIFQPPVGTFTLIPNETRVVFLQQAGYTTAGANWSTNNGSTCSWTSGSPTITGTSILDCRGGWVQIKAPSSGSTCSTSGSVGSFVFSSATTMTVTATAKDAGASPNTITLQICTPAITTHNVPAFRGGIYIGQPIDVQSIVVGSIDKTGVWSITTNPGSAGSISDTTNRDTVFTATAAGRYVITFTPNTAGASTSTTVLDVTSNALPYNVTADKTEPYNCKTDANLGTVYDVGPTQTYADLTALTTAHTPVAGDQIHIHNEDLSGVSPTVFNNYLALQVQATQTNWFTLCGIPDATGHLPILDASAATSTYFNAGSGLQGLSQIQIYNQSLTGYGAAQSYPQFIEIAGVHLKNANDTNNYWVTGNSHTTSYNWGTGPNSTNTAPSATPHTNFVSGIRIQNGTDINLIGNKIESMGNGLYTEALGVEGKMSRWLLAEGNYDTDYGYATTPIDTIHGFYIQSFGEVVQFNYIGKAHTGALGGTFKSRGVWEYVRYNFFDANDSSSRVLDYVDAEDPCYAAPEQYYNSSCYGLIVSDPNMNLSVLSGYNEARHTENFHYGNTSISKSSLSWDHFLEDHSPNLNRMGTQWRYNNTHYFVNPGTFVKPIVTDNWDGNFVSTYEWPRITSYNDIAWMDGVGTGTLYMQFNSNRASLLTTVGSIYNSGSTNDQVNGSDGTGWIIKDTSQNNAIYSDYDNLPSNLTGFGANLATIPNSTSTRPFSATTYKTNAGANGVTLPANMAVLPVRFNFLPTSLYAVPRTVIVNGTNTALAGSVDALGTVTLSSMALTPNPGAVNIGGVLALTCTATYSDSSFGVCASPTWVSSVTAKATVDSSGNVTGVAAGTTSITANIGAVFSPGDTITVSAPTPPIAFKGALSIKGRAVTF